MNFSRYAYFKALCNNITLLKKKPKRYKSCRLKIIEEIDFRINSVYKKAHGGYWGICDGDQTYISFLEKLKKELDLKYPNTGNLAIEGGRHAEKCIKVVFFAQETSVWPSLQSIYEACILDPRYSVKLVYLPFSNINSDNAVNHFQNYVDNGYPIVQHDQYNLTQDNPDVAFYVKPYDLIPSQYFIEEVEKVVRRCVYVPYAFFDDPSHISRLYGYQLLLHFKAWKIIAYSRRNVAGIKKYGYCNGRNAILLGHPRFDITTGSRTHNEDKTRSFYKKKINGRRVLLWNTHHGISDDYESFGAFLQYKDEVFQYFRNHRNLVLLWRPHPLLFGALQTEKVMTEADIAELKKQIKEQDNIILDESKDYLNAFDLSDGMLADGGPSLTFEYVATGKPVYYTVKHNGLIMPYDSIAECWYKIGGVAELNGYLDMFSRDEDPSKQERIRKFQNHADFIDGHCGERIKDYIYSELVREELNSADYLLGLK